jgi:hypothetical protein
MCSDLVTAVFIINHNDCLPQFWQALHVPINNGRRGKPANVNGPSLLGLVLSSWRLNLQVIKQVQE